jgi:alkylation response protein AidB-like acyl-CoA dehydrogenase
MEKQIWLKLQKFWRNRLKKNSYTDLYKNIAKELSLAKDNLSDKIQICGSAGLLRHALPVEHGGYDDTFEDMCLIHEELGYQTKDSGLIVSLNAQLWSCIFPLLSYGTQEQQKEYLEPLLMGRLIAAQAITEPENGSDVAAMKTTSNMTTDGYILNGSKKYITNVTIADLIVVYARDEDDYSAFLVKPSDKGVSFLRLDLDGFSSSDIGEIHLDNCFVPASRLLGQRKFGLSILQYALELERAFIFSGIVGVMKNHMDVVKAHVMKKKSNNKSLIKNQAISHKLAEMSLLIETMRLWIYNAARMATQNQRLNLVSSYTKLYVSEAYLQYYLHAVQILGAAGLGEPHRLSQSVLDALAGRLMSGTSEIQKNIISALTGISNSFLPTDIIK